MTRLRPGAYSPTEEWQDADSAIRHLLLIEAADTTARGRIQFSHDSAALIWSLPSLTPWPEQVHEVVPATVRSGRRGIVRHTVGLDPDAVVREGVEVTSLPRTLVDMAGTTTFVRSVAMLDAALRRSTPAARLRERLVDLLPHCRLAAPSRAKAAIEFADGRAESPGESLTRVQLRALGFPPPEPQVPFYDGDGLIGVVDFYWPDHDLVLEFDGREKYGLERRMQRGLSPEDILWQEKKREDRLRSVVRALARATWAETVDRRRLAGLLIKHGLPRRPRSTTLRFPPSG